MARLTGNKPMFDEEDIRSTIEPGLPRLIRIIFARERITNESYLAKYHHYFREIADDGKTMKEHSQKAASDRKFLQDPRKLSFRMMAGILAAMGFDIEGISIRLRDRLTGEVQTYSTDDTIEDIRESLQRKEEVGIDSIL